MIQPVGIDLYPGDHPCDWSAYLAAGPPWSFVILKISQGLDYRYDAWAARQLAQIAPSPRFGEDLFIGYYHYLTLHQSGLLQADFAVRCMRGIHPDKSPGQMPLMVDVERGGQRIANPSKDQVEDVTRTFAARYTELTGRSATLYGGELLRSVRCTDRLGCGRSAIALYGATLPHDVIARTGTDLEHLMLWQYRGTEPQTSGPAGYPMEAPGCGVVDISALVLPGGLVALRKLCS